MYAIKIITNTNETNINISLINGIFRFAVGEDLNSCFEQNDYSYVDYITNNFTYMQCTVPYKSNFITDFQPLSKGVEEFKYGSLINNYFTFSIIKNEDLYNFFSDKNKIQNSIVKIYFFDETNNYLNLLYTAFITNVNFSTNEINIVTKVTIDTNTISLQNPIASNVYIKPNFSLSGDNNKTFNFLINKVEKYTNYVELYIYTNDNTFKDYYQDCKYFNFTYNITEQEDEKLFLVEEIYKINDFNYIIKTKAFTDEDILQIGKIVYRQNAEFTLFDATTLPPPNVNFNISNIISDASFFNNFLVGIINGTQIKLNFNFTVYNVIYLQTTFFTNETPTVAGRIVGFVLVKDEETVIANSEIKSGALQDIYIQIPCVGSGTKELTLEFIGDGLNNKNKTNYILAIKLLGDVSLCNILKVYYLQNISVYMPTSPILVGIVNNNKIITNKYILQDIFTYSNNTLFLKDLTINNNNKNILCKLAEDSLEDITNRSGFIFIYNGNKLSIAENQVFTSLREKINDIFINDIKINTLYSNLQNNINAILKIEAYLIFVNIPIKADFYAEIPFTLKAIGETIINLQNTDNKLLKFSDKLTKYIKEGNSLLINFTIVTTPTTVELKTKIDYNITASLSLDYSNFLFYIPPTTQPLTYLLNNIKMYNKNLQTEVVNFLEGELCSSFYFNSVDDLQNKIEELLNNISMSAFLLSSGRLCILNMFSNILTQTDVLERVEINVTQIQKIEDIFSEEKDSEDKICSLTINYNFVDEVPLNSFTIQAITNNPLDSVNYINCTINNATINICKQLIYNKQYYNASKSKELNLKYVNNSSIATICKLVYYNLLLNGQDISYYTITCAGVIKAELLDFITFYKDLQKNVEHGIIIKIQYTAEGTTVFKVAVLKNKNPIRATIINTGLGIKKYINTTNSTREIREPFTL